MKLRNLNTFFCTSLRWKANKNAKKVVTLAAVIISMFVFLYCENNLITITRINVESSKLPDGFDGYKIIHISDLHSKEFGREQKYLVPIIKSEKPELWV
ncbi:putative MPP superfamily phosphohydrolase [Caldicoprobacter guelmensis]|nr:putative MPP superfamily phosphohydrolase [Caldicoprobacter guelmensis]